MAVEGVTAVVAITVPLGRRRIMTVNECIWQLRCSQHGSKKYIKGMGRSVELTASSLWLSLERLLQPEER